MYMNNNIFFNSLKILVYLMCISIIIFFDIFIPSFFEES